MVRRALDCGLRKFRNPLSLLLRLVTQGGCGVCSVPLATLVSRCLTRVRRVGRSRVRVRDRFLRVTSHLVCVGAMDLLPGRSRIAGLGRRLANRLLRCVIYRRVTGGFAAVRSKFGLFAELPDSVRISGACVLGRSGRIVFSTCVTTINEKRHELPPSATPFAHVITGGVITISAGVIFIVHSL